MEVKYLVSTSFTILKIALVGDHKYICMYIRKYDTFICTYLSHDL